MPTSDANIISGKQITDSIVHRTQTMPTETWQSSANGLHVLSVDDNNHLSSNHIPDSPSHSRDLAREGIHPTESASNVSGSSNTTESRDDLAARIRELQMQMVMMTREIRREISRFMVPPAYFSQNGSALGGQAGE
ncbi:hypothetical protein VKT23_006159 [Stygiomarasmius scandens]|uniref:Uncharacterized protein n=1 Tax=Marasmiellus scandens TaxID=2682957 RepID=A0ABR1JPD3_9AGAR